MWEREVNHVYAIEIMDNSSEILDYNLPEIPVKATVTRQEEYMQPMVNHWHNDFAVILQKEHIVLLEIGRDGLGHGQDCQPVQQHFSPSDPADHGQCALRPGASGGAVRRGGQLAGRGPDDEKGHPRHPHGFAGGAGASACQNGV